MRVAQSTFASKCLSQSLTFSFLLVWIHLFLLPSPQVKPNGRAGKAPEHRRGSFVASRNKESTMATSAFATDQRNCPDPKPSFDHNMKYHVRFAYLDAKKKTKNKQNQKPSVHPGQLSSRSQNSISSCQQARRVQQHLQQTLPSAPPEFSIHSLYSMHRCLKCFHPLLYSQITNAFILLGEEPTKLYSKKSPVWV